MYQLTLLTNLVEYIQYTAIFLSAHMKNFLKI